MGGKALAGINKYKRFDLAGIPSTQIATSLLGHSWGGVLAIEYALKFQQHIKGLTISNMMASIPAYNEYAQRVMMPAMDQKALAEIKAIEAAEDYWNPRYMELLMEHHYVHHLLRMPVSEWPDPVNRVFKHLNARIYIPIQGPASWRPAGSSSSSATWRRAGRASATLG